MSVDVAAAAEAPEFAAMLDGAAAEESSLHTRLCLLTEFSRAVDQAFAESAAVAGDPLHELVTRHSAIVRGVVTPSLVAHNLTVARWDELTRAARGRMSQLFTRRVYPALTPLTVDSTHPFPQPPSLSLNLAISVVDHARRTERFTTLTIPPVLPRLLQVSGGTLLPLEALVAANLDEVFPGSDVVSMGCFRVTRAVGRGLTGATRLEIEAAAGEATVAVLRRGLGVTDQAIYALSSSLLMGDALTPLIPLVPAVVPRQRAALSSARTTTAARAATRSDPESVARHRPTPASPRAAAAIEARAG